MSSNLKSALAARSQLQKEPASGGARARRIGSRAPTLDARAGFDPARLVFIDETCTITNIGSETAGNFYIWQRVVPPFRAYLAGMVQTYPTRPVHWIVSFSEGGPNDIVARLNGQTCQKNWVNNSSVNLLH